MRGRTARAATPTARQALTASTPQTFARSALEIARRTILPRRTSITRSEEHTSELQSLMRISYAVFCLKKKNRKEIAHDIHHILSQQIKHRVHLIQKASNKTEY